MKDTFNNMSLEQRLDIAAGVLRPPQKEKNEWKVETRGRPSGPSGFSDFHHEICRLLALGWRSFQIQEHLGVSSPTVQKVKNSPIGRTLIQSLRRGRDNQTVDIVDGIRKLEPIALNVLEEAMVEEGVPWSTKANVALKVISEIGGHAAPKKVQVAHAILTPDMIEQLKKDADAAGIKVYESKEESLSIPNQYQLDKKKEESLSIEEVEFSILEEGDEV